MKRITITSMILVLIVLLAFPSYSQIGKLKLGIRGGLNLATSNEELPNVPELEGGNFTHNVIPRLGIGVFAEYPLLQKFYLQLNVLYNQKGDRFKGTYVEDFVGIIDVDSRYMYDYLTVPVLLKYQFLNSEAKPYLILGPEIGYLLKAKQKLDASIMVIDLDTALVDTDIKDNLKSVEFAFSFGAGINFPVGQFKGFIEGRYGLGLTAINKEGDQNIRNSVIYFNLGFQL
jgi:hypothetical protein